MSGPPVVEIAAVVKSYGGLRPLRLRALVVSAAERVAVSGVDAAAAEMFVNLVTGATLPDEGTVITFGRRTSDIASGDDWIASLDRFGIVSDRAVLLEGSTVAQNLALPYTLAIDPVEPGVLRKVEALAAECGIPRDALAQQVGAVAPALRARVHVARALALGPDLLVLEHPTASLPDRERAPFGTDVARVCEARRTAALALTLDDAFAKAFAHRSLALHAATGELKDKKRGWW